MEKLTPSSVEAGPRAAGQPSAPPDRWQGGMLVFTAAMVMLATLPGRTQGLGLITEPLIADLRLDRVQFANFNVLATLIGALFCFPAGWIFDRFGLKSPTAIITVALAAVVWGMSFVGGSMAALLALLIATRGLGQSALSVASITAVGRLRDRAGMAMAAFSVTLSLLFVVGFVAVGYLVGASGWWVAWRQVGLGLLLFVLPLILSFLPSARPRASVAISNEAGMSLGQALATPAFWIFAGTAALFNFVSSGLGLFNESVLAERGFDQRTFTTFLGVTTLLSLVGQFMAGVLSKKYSYRHLIAVAMVFYSVGLTALTLVKTKTQLFSFSIFIGVAGGMIIVVFFAVWSETFGRRHLGRIQGAAQFITVVSSAIGPAFFARSHAASQSYAPLLHVLSVIVLLVGLVALKVRMPKLVSA